jgi:predicted nuclease of predicted toxin-antitoxin system
VRFLIDAQLPPGLARRLAEAGHEAIHVAEIGLSSATDPDIWRAAVERAAVLVTKDHDFVVARTSADGGPTIVWVRLGNINNAALTARFLGALDAITSAAKRGDAVIELAAFGGRK